MKGVRTDLIRTLRKGCEEMGIFDNLKDKVQDKLDDRRERVEEWADQRHQERMKDTQSWKKGRVDKIDDAESAGKISPELAEKQRKRVEEREQKKLEKLQKKKEREEKPVETRVIETGKKVGNMVIAGVKTIETSGGGRSGKRATLAYRRENRAYNSEARKMRSQITPLSSFSAGLLGANAPPVRSKYPGSRETGSIDPLSNWSSGIMGASRVRQDSTMEGIASKMAGRQNPGRKPKKSNKDPLASLTRNLMGGR
jgi:hypothetical protein